VRTHENADDFRVSRLLQGGAALAPTGGEHHVFRAAVLSIVLTLAVGQSAALLCRVWCDPHQAATTGCHHQGPTTSASVSGDDNCANVVLSAAFVREDVRREASGPAAWQVVAVPWFRFAPPPTDTRSSYDPGQQVRLEDRPLAIAHRL
jgi:hypothetical protein